jgi:hypothetical protein
MYLVAWSVRVGIMEDGGARLVDHWKPCEERAEAEAFYRDLLASDVNVYVASVCAVVESTDYPTALPPGVGGPVGPR